jgi:hypothetical protein
MPYYKSGSKALMTINTYRNLHHHFLAKFKREYGDTIKSLLVDIDPIQNPVKLDYQFYFKGNKKIDVGNVGAMVDKVFSDCLVELGILKDDSLEYVNKVSYSGYNKCSSDMIIVEIKEP